MRQIHIGCLFHMPIEPRPQRTRPAVGYSIVSELLDGTLRLTFGAHILAWTEVSTRPLKPKPEPRPPAPNQPPYKPAANHPWRRGQ